jgi:predicted alpha/beta superfamily hydrolase
MADADHPATVPKSRSFRVAAPDCSGELRIDVANPEGAFLQPVPPGRHPVVMVLDGDLTFGTAAGVSRGMQLMGELPPHFVVAIGYEDGSDLGEFNRRRALDLSPWPLPLPPTYAQWPTGGGDRFLAALLERVWPALESRLQVAASARHLVGLSLGGLFVAHVLHTRPSEFSGFGILSPRLGDHDDRMVRELARFDAAKLRPGARVFVGVGGDEDVPGAGPLENMTDNAVRLADTLKLRGVPLESAVFAGETHTSVIGVALSRALRSLLGTRNQPVDGQFGSGATSRE